MNNKERIQQQLISGKAVGVGPSKAFVPMGKMLGTWYCDEFTEYSSHTGPQNHRVWELAGWARTNGWGRKKDFGKSRIACDALRKTGIRKLQREFEPWIAWLAARTGLNQEALTILFLMTGTKMFAAYQEHPARFVENFRGLNGPGMRNLLTKPLRFRWDLIIWLYKMPWKHAIRRLWPTASRQVLKEITWNEICSGRSRSATQTLRWAMEDGSFAAHKEWRAHRLLLCRHISKIQWLNYCRRFGNEGGSRLTNYFRELSRAKAENLVLPVWPNGISEPAEAHRRHQEISKLLLLHAEKGAAEIVEQHKLNWSKLSLPEGWRPLFTLADFRLEGEVMHHCVGGYFRSSHFLFAHLEHTTEKGIEKATIQWQPSPTGRYQISQLYGVCNAPVSDEFRIWVEGCLGKMTKPNGQRE